MNISLEELLESRDRRAAMQKDLLDKYPGKSLLCLTVQLPGPEKRNAVSLAIADAGVAAISKVFTPEVEILRDLETGFEAYFIVSCADTEAKKLAAGIEDSHPLGRLMDIDVIGLEGPISRESIGLGPRPCLICGQPARVCMRARTHSTEELIETINAKVDNYLKANFGNMV